VTREFQIGDQVILRDDPWGGDRRRLWTVMQGQAELRLEGFPDVMQIKHLGSGMVVTRSAYVAEVRLFRSVEEQVAEKLMGDA
jgi:hypothetical protein